MDDHHFRAILLALHGSSRVISDIRSLVFFALGFRLYNITFHLDEAGFSV